ncbi:MAG: DNA repair protein RecN, partial [Oscillospiraceae bacterium]|nr:DNA repair protein RecN [Oscillospiraceae bacterium]
MLESLSISNLALISRVELGFGQGLNVLTGETGAGKSIVVDAISAVIGSRVEKTLVRSGADALSVTAEFSGLGELAWFSENDIPPDDTLIVTRKVTAEGKSSCRVNGAPVTVTQLRALGEFLIDVHGQNDGMRLLDERAHLAVLDAFGGNAALLARYRDRFEELWTTEKLLDKLRGDDGALRARAELLRDQIEDIEAGALRIGEEAELEERLAMLKNASRLHGALDGAYEALYGGDDSDGAAALLRDAETFLEDLNGFSASFRELFERARDLRYNAEDIAEEVRAARQSVEFSLEELDGLSDRLAEISRLTRKYGGDEPAALAYLERAQKELCEIDVSDERRVELERERNEKYAAARISAQELTAARISAAENLKHRLEEELAQLAMPSVRFAVRFTENSGLGRDGAEGASFLMSANAGEEPGRVSKIASGGELSRIMLALKNVLGESDPVDVMVFDEVDAGVSGIAAQRVGEKLSELARRRQILVVTHLPQ